MRLQHRGDLARLFNVSVMGDAAGALTLLHGAVLPLLAGLCTSDAGMGAAAMVPAVQLHL